LKYEIEIE